jgi:hypothetical protein
VRAGLSRTPEPLRTLIESGPLAHVVTINPDGSPQTTVVWIALDGDTIISGHMNLSKKLRTVQRDPRVSSRWRLRGSPASSSRSTR